MANGDRLRLTAGLPAWDFLANIQAASGKILQPVSGVPSNSRCSARGFR
jgi:hypothetical protein